jgi:hypothetical protein
LSHTQAQWAGGNTPSVSAYTGSIGELVLKTDDWNLQAQSGTAPGGRVVRPLVRR